MGIDRENQFLEVIRWIRWEIASFLTLARQSIKIKISFLERILPHFPISLLHFEIILIGYHIDLNNLMLLSNIFKKL